jgi:hypothetical protein
MRYFRQKRCLLAWIACLAVLLNALMPAVSHAMAAHEDDSAGWTAICSASGTKFAPSPFNQPVDDNNNTAAIDVAHCPYCLSHTGWDGTLPAHGLALGQVTAASALPIPFYLFPIPSNLWAKASPRAPPLPA